MEKKFTLEELSLLLGAELKGIPHQVITGVATLQQAEYGEIAFLDNSRYLKYLPFTKASAVILSPEHLSACNVNALVTPKPYLAYAKVSQIFAYLPQAKPGIHPTAVIMENCDIDSTASIGAHCVIEKNCKIGKNVILGPGCVLGEFVEVGDDSRLWANVTVYYGVLIGQRVSIHSSAVIGSDGFGYAKNGAKWEKIPQLGRVIIGDDVEIGASTTIDRGALDDTVIGQGVKLDNQIQIGHNVKIGEGTAIAACTGISGSVKIGKHCMISGMVGFTGHFEIADHVVITGMTMVSKGLSKPGMYSSGTPIEAHESWKKNAVRFRQLDDMARRLRELEQKMDLLETVNIEECQEK